jgi:hypothetical protein
VTTPRWTTSIFALWLGLALLAALPLMASAETQQEIASRILQALHELSFTANLVLTTTEEGETVLAGKLYRMPPDRFRLERWDERGLSDYLLEDPHLSIRVFPRERRAYAMRRHQLTPVFGMMGMFTEGAIRQGKADMQEAVVGGAKVYIFSSGQPGSRVKFVVGASDYLPRELVLGFDKQTEAVVLKLASVEVAKKSLSPDLFVVPEDYSIVGFPKGMGERERVRLRLFQERIRERMGAGRGPMAEQMAPPPAAGKQSAADRGNLDEEYLPALPSYLPKGFGVYSVTPLYFTDNLIFHVEIINPSHSQLISLFETQNEKFGNELKNSSFARERHVLFGEHEESGLFVLLMSEDVAAEELRRVLESLEDQPELSAKLIDEALQRLLGSS